MRSHRPVSLCTDLRPARCHSLSSSYIAVAVRSTIKINISSLPPSVSVSLVMHPCLCLATLPSPPHATLAFPSRKTSSSFKSTSGTSTSNSSSPILSTTTITSTSSRRTNWDRTIDYLSHCVGLQDPLTAVSRNPALRSQPLSSLHHSHSLLLSTGLSPAQIARLCSSFPLLLTHPNLPTALHFLRPLFPPHHLPLCISRCPRLLLSPVPTQLLPALYFLQTLSIPLTLHSSILLMSNVQHTLLPKVLFLRSSLSIPLTDLKPILCKFPKILTFSIPNNLAPKLLFLQNHMNLHPRTEITAFPQYFAFSLDNRIKRRHRILTQHRLHMPLPHMLIPSDAEFDEAILDLKLQALHSHPHHHPLTPSNDISSRNLL